MEKIEKLTSSSTQVVDNDTSHSKEMDRQWRREKPSMKSNPKNQLDSIDSTYKSQSFPTGVKRSRPNDFSLPDIKLKKRENSHMDLDQVGQEALGRIRSSAHCKEKLELATSRGLPEIFIDSKENMRREANYGRDIVNECNSNRSLIENGQEAQGPTSWGRAFIFLPWLKRVEVLSDFSSILNHVPSLSLISDIVSIGDMAEEECLSRVDVYAAPARLDLLFRFGLLGCRKNEQVADKIKSVIPPNRQKNAYSFALQNAADFDNLAMVKYCHANNASAISPNEDLYDYRGDSPIEIAFQSGSKEIRDFMLQMIDKKKDLPELKTLFLDEDRWKNPPEVIMKLIYESDKVA